MRQIVLLLSFLSAWQACAAEVQFEPDGPHEFRKIELQGKIAKGDAARVERLLEGEDNTVIFLDSTGGDYREGLLLAKLFQARKVRTFVDAGESCLSACAIAFLGGMAFGEEGTEPFARSISPRAHLGFHAPFLDIGLGEIKVEQVERAYDNAIRTVTDFVREARSLGISAEVAADMMTPQRSDLYRVRTLLDLVRIGVEIEDVKDAPAITRSMIVNLCVNGWVGNQPSPEAIAEAEADISHLTKDLDWPVPMTAEVVSGYFSFQPVQVKRSVIPMIEAGEGSGYYSCMIDHGVVEGKLRLANRGYIFTEDAETIMERATAFGGPDYENLSTIDVVNNFTIAGLTLSWEDWNEDIRVGVVPMLTPIDEINDVIDRYVASEPAL